MHLNKDVWISIQNWQICSLGFYWQYASFASDNGLAPFRRQAIIWNDGSFKQLKTVDISARCNLLQA